MNEYNCNALKRLPVPDTLIEKALAIPERAENQPAPLPWYRNVRVVAAAASVVLVATLGISLYFFFGNINPIPVVPEVPQTASEIATNPPTDAHSKPVTDGVTETASDPKTTATDAYHATQSPSQPSPTEIAAPTSPTRFVEPTVPATTQGASAVPIATQTPSVQPTAPSEFLPEPPTDNETQGNDPLPGTPACAEIIFSVQTDLLSDSRTVYCVLYDLAGNRIDNEEILSPKHLAVTNEVFDDLTEFLYCPPAEWYLPTGMYEMDNYNADGVLIRERKPVFLYNE